MVVVTLLTALAKKLLKEQAKKFGKAVYDRTLKPVLEGLKKKAKEYVSNLARKPSARKAKKAQRELDKINEDIRTVETERAKIPGGPDFGGGPEIELGSPPKGNRLPPDEGQSITARRSRLHRIKGFPRGTDIPTRSF